MNRNRIADISGQWEMQNNTTIFSELDEVMLPGCADNQGIGVRDENPSSRSWSREFNFEGKLFLERRIGIEEVLEGKQYILHLERCHWEVRVTVNEQYVGVKNNISTPQEFDISNMLKCGENKIQLEIDNTMIYPLRNSTHHFTKDTQGNWCGVIGDLYIEERHIYSIQRVKIHTDFEKKEVNLDIFWQNSGKEQIVDLKFVNKGTDTLEIFEESILLNKSFCITTHKLELNQKIFTWSHFEPNQYQLSVEYNGYCYEENYGFIEFKSMGNHICVNDNIVKLRGVHDACVFPENGYPPMEKEAWKSVFLQYQEMGLNHFRAHSWCPPEAAFAAADEVGIYMQVEGPASGTLGKGQSVEGEKDPIQESKEIENYVLQELYDIQNWYGNHPSFCMLSIGNELHTDYTITSYIVDCLKKNDDRQLITGGSNNNWGCPHIGKNDDFFVGFMLDRWTGLLRGAYHLENVGHINNKVPSTDITYESAANKVHIPIIVHELGQYSVYPNYNEIEKYNGAMRANHLLCFKKSMDENGLEGMDIIFSLASGELQQRLYKEEMEAIIRTSNIAGYQLLDIKDFPGQQVALCGVLDVFRDEKEYFDIDSWRQVCADVVPLAYLSKRIYISTEDMSIPIKVANYSNKEWNDVEISWKIEELYTEKVETYKVGHVIKRQIMSGIIKECTKINKGCITDFGDLQFRLPEDVGTGKYILTIDFEKYNNSWEFFVYSKETIYHPKNVKVAEHWNYELEKLLENGGKVFFNGTCNNLRNTIKGAFQTNFWSYRMFAKYDPAGTLGLYVDNTHEIFDHVPTDFYSNWQWYRMAKDAMVIDISYLPKCVKPIVWVIDTYERNKRLAFLLEISIGKGTIVISAFDFLRNLQYPEVINLYNGIMKYMEKSRELQINKLKTGSVDGILTVETVG